MRSLLVLLFIFHLCMAWDGVEYHEREEESAPFVQPSPMDVRAGENEWQEESHQIRSAMVYSAASVEHSERVNKMLMAQHWASVTNFQDLQKATIEQRFWIAGIADRISELKSYFTDGFTGFWATIFYFFSALGIWMLTGIRRTENARVWLVLLLGTFAVLECGSKQKRLADFESEPDEMPDARLISQFLHAEAWTIRRIFVALAVGVLACFFYSYEDEILSIRLEIGGMKKELQDLLGAIATRGETSRKIVDGATGIAGKVKDLMERASSMVRDSITPSRENAPDSSMRHPNLAHIAEVCDEEGNKNGTPDRYRRSRERTPVDLSRLTPLRHQQSSVRKQNPSAALRSLLTVLLLTMPVVQAEESDECKSYRLAVQIGGPIFGALVVVIILLLCHTVCPETLRKFFCFLCDRWGGRGANNDNSQNNPGNVSTATTGGGGTRGTASDTVLSMEDPPNVPNSPRSQAKQPLVQTSPEGIRVKNRGSMVMTVPHHGGVHQVGPHSFHESSGGRGVTRPNLVYDPTINPEERPGHSPRDPDARKLRSTSPRQT